MKRTKGLAFVILAIIFCSVIAFAQGPDENNPPPMDEQMKEKPMGGMVMNMMGMMPKQMVASNDGGVIILIGNKLLKYDKDLNLIKEVEIKNEVELKIDAGSMQDMIEKMKEKYGKHDKATTGECQSKEAK